MTEVGCVMRAYKWVRRRRIREEAEGRRKDDAGREEQKRLFPRVARRADRNLGSRKEYHIISFTATASLASEGSREVWR